MRAGIAIAALLGVAGFSVTACAQTPMSNFGPTPVYQDVGCAGGCGVPAAGPACGGGSCLSGVNLGYLEIRLRDNALDPLCCRIG